VSADTVLTVAFDPLRSGTAYVVNTGNDSVTPINMATDTVEREITGFHGPRSIAISPDGGTAYVVNVHNSTVTPINLATNRIEPAITGFAHPGPIAISHSGATAYVLEDGRRLVPVDLTTHLAEPAITFAKGSGLGDHASSIAITPRGDTAFLGTFARRTGTVTAVDLATGRVKAVIHGFDRPVAIAIAPDGRTAYVADAARGDVMSIEFGAHRAIKASAIPARGVVPGADSVAVGANGNAFVASASPTDTASVGLIDPKTGAEKTVRLIGFARPDGIAVDPNGGTLYVTTANDSLVPIDVATATERPAVSRLHSPGAIAVTVPPPLYDSVKLSAWPRSAGTAVRVKLTCTSPTTPCRTTLSLISMIAQPTEAGPQAQHAARVRLVGIRAIMIRPRGTLTALVRLNDYGQRMLKRVGSLRAMLIVAIDRGGHHTDTLNTRQITIRPSRR
jgi:YVTN family beta-propeller protein